MRGGDGGPLERLLESWAGLVYRFRVAVVAVGTLATVSLGWYAAGSLGIDTETTDLFPSHLTWRAAMDDYMDRFPHVGHTLLVVVDGRTPHAAESARDSLAARLRGRGDVFETVYAPGASEYFRENGLLFLDPGELRGLEARLRGFAPWLRRLERSPGLGTFAAVLDSTLEAETRRSELQMEPVLGLVADAFRRAAARQPHEVPWSDLLGGGTAAGGSRRAFIMARPRLDYERARPGREAIAAVRGAVDSLGLDAEPGVRVRLTGRVAMQDEEIRSVSRGAGLAGILALVLVGLVLYAGLGSGRLIFASMATLVAGLVGTAAFAAATVGHLNLISVAFAVLYIGLGVDYAVHLGLRYRELRGEASVPDALRRALGDVGPSLALSAATTAVAFYAFVPTDFAGISELGLISGSGMFVSFLASVTLLPALLGVLPLGPDPSPVPARPALDALARIPARHRRRIVLGAVLLGVASLALLPRSRFDPNPLRLRDPGTESVSTYVELLGDERTSPLTMALLRSSPEEAARAAERAGELEVVGSARTLASFVPDRQEEKLPVMEEIRAVLGPAPGTVERAETVEASFRAVERIRLALMDFIPRAPGPERRRAAGALWQIGRWQDLAELWPPEGRRFLVDELRRSLLGALPDRVSAIRRGLAREPVTRSDLPEELVRRWVSPEGLHRVEVVPAENLAGAEALERFVAGVLEVFPDATGAPVVRYQAGNVAVQAFRRALLLAALATVLVLGLTLRSLRDTVQVLLPVALAGLVTVGGSVLLGIPFNFANMIALPLLLGVGVDNGIHMVHRSRLAGAGGPALLRSSTGHAVVVSFLTTVFSFGNLAFSPHRGMASMGQLLAVGMAVALAATVLLLPVLLEAGRPGPQSPKRSR